MAPHAASECSEDVSQIRNNSQISSNRAKRIRRGRFQKSTVIKDHLEPNDGRHDGQSCRAFGVEAISQSSPVMVFCSRQQLIFYAGDEIEKPERSYSWQSRESRFHSGRVSTENHRCSKAAVSSGEWGKARLANEGGQCCDSEVLVILKAIIASADSSFSQKHF
jgi:hypothetical protein